MTGMETVDIFKALANDTRLTILMWLKEPEKYFPPQGIHIPEGDSFDHSVCVGAICGDFSVHRVALPRHAAAGGAPRIAPLREVDVLPAE